MNVQIAQTVLGNKENGEPTTKMKKCSVNDGIFTTLKMIFKFHFCNYYILRCLFNKLVGKL